MPKRGPYRPAKLGDRRRSEYRKQELREQFAQRPIDRETGKILPELQDWFAQPPAPARSGASDFDPTPTDALDDDLGAILSRTSREVERVRSALGVRDVEALGNVQNKQDAPHADLTSTRGIAQFDFGPEPLQPVPLSTKQTHKPDFAGAILTSIPTTIDNSGAAASSYMIKSWIDDLAAALKRSDPAGAKIAAQRLLMQGRTSRAALHAFISGFRQ